MSAQTQTTGFTEAFVPVYVPFDPERAYGITDETGTEFSFGVRATVGDDPTRLDITPTVIEGAQPRYTGAAADEDGYQAELTGYQVLVGNVGMNSTVISAASQPVRRDGASVLPHSPLVAVDAATELCEALGVKVSRSPMATFGPTIAVPPAYKELVVAHGDIELRHPGISVGQLAAAAVRAAVAVIRHYPDGTVGEYTINRPVQSQ